MIPALIVFAYLAVVLYIGIFAFRRAARQRGGRGLLPGQPLAGPVRVPAVALRHQHDRVRDPGLLGPRLQQRDRDLRPDGLVLAALVIPLTLFLIGTRVWALGKRFGFMTPVQMFRDRWEMRPHRHGDLRGAGRAAGAVHHHRRDGRRHDARGRSAAACVPYWLGGAIVALVVMSYVFFGGMRGTAWVNTFQTMLFLGFGAVAVVVIGGGHGRLPRPRSRRCWPRRHGAAAHARAHLAARTSSATRSSRSRRSRSRTSRSSA